MNRQLKNIALIAIIAIAFFVVKGGFEQSDKGPTTVDFSAAWQMATKGEIASGTFTKDQFRFETKKHQKYVTNLVAQPETLSNFQSDLRKNGVKFNQDRSAVPATGRFGSARGRSRRSPKRAICTGSPWAP